MGHLKLFELRERQTAPRDLGLGAQFSYDLPLGTHRSHIRTNSPSGVLAHLRQEIPAKFFIYFHDDLSTGECRNLLLKNPYWGTWEPGNIGPGNMGTGGIIGTGDSGTSYKNPYWGTKVSGNIGTEEHMTR